MADSSIPLADAGRAASPRRYGLTLGVICLVGAILRLLLIIDQQRHNPFYDYPINDAAVYWEWAGEIADGGWLDDEPFLSAPLYPYLIAPLRMAGLGFTSVYIVQALMQVATAVVIAASARRRFGDRPALWAAGLFLFLNEPAAHGCRVLNNSLQLFLAALLWQALLIAQPRPCLRRSAWLGVVLGLNCLATPAFMLLVVLVGPWLWWQHRRRRVAWPAAILAPVTAAGLIAPATWHNWRACGEFIPVRVSGLAFFVGNHRGSDGFFTPTPGIRSDRAGMYVDARRIFVKETGQTPTWRAMDDFYYRRAMSELRADPAAAARLFATKLFLFFTAQYYDDIQPSYFERRAGYARSLYLTPVASPWVLCPAAVMLIVLLRRPVRYLPELILFVIPLISVVGFYYNPRYRMPALVVAPVLAAWGLVLLRRGLDRAPRLSWALKISTIVGLLSGTVNAALQLDDPARWTAMWDNTVGLAMEARGRIDEAVVHVEQAAAKGPEVWLFRAHLARLYETLGRVDEARVEFEAAAMAGPDSPAPQRDCAEFMLKHGFVDAAIAPAARLVEIDPRSLDARLLLHQALSAAGRHADVIANLRGVLDAGGRHPLILNALAWVLATCPDDSLRDGPGAVELALEAIQRSGMRGHEMLDTLAAARAETRQFPQAIEAAREAVTTARAIGDERAAADIAARLSLYEAGNPYRQPATRLDRPAGATQPNAETSGPAATDAEN